MPDKHFIKSISPDGGDRLRIRITTRKGKVVNVMVQYEAIISGIWHEIVRYDCAHGFFHRDIMYPKGKKEKQPIMIENLNDALQYAEQDIKDRWSWYKERYNKEIEKMTKDEIIKKNISLSFDFIRYIVKNPDMLDKVSDDCEIDFFEPDLPIRGIEKRISDSGKSVFRVEHTFREMVEV